MSRQESGLNCAHRPLVARCVEPSCRCLDAAGVLIDRPEQAPPGYAVEGGGLCPACAADYDADTPRLCECCGVAPAMIAYGEADATGHVWHWSVCRQCHGHCSSDDDGRPVHMKPGWDGSPDTFESYRADPTARRREEMKKADRFQKGSGCFPCQTCGKMTRSTGRGDNEHVRLCARCYDRAGDENSVADGIMTQEEFDEKWHDRGK